MDPSVGDDFPLDELTRHAAWLRRLARELLYDREGAEDVVQSAWLAALSSGPLREGTQGAWLAGVVRRLSRQRTREEARRRRRERAAARAEAIEGPPSSLERLELTRLLVDTVRALDEPYWTTLLWRFFDDLSLREIARRRGVPLETARTHLKRGLEQVRCRLDARPEASRESLLGALVPLAGPMPLAWKLGGTSVGKAALEGAGAIGMSGKAGLAGVALIALAITVWTLRETKGAAPEEDVGVATGAIELESQSLPEPLADVPQADPLTPPSEEPTRNAAGERAAAIDGGAIVRGRVLDPDGNPIAGATVSAAGEEALSDADGVYELQRTWLGTIYVEALAKGWSQVRKTVKSGGGALTEVDFELRAEFRVVGRVEDEFDNPLEGAEVTSFYTHGNAATTGFDGSFILGSLDPGRPEHSITARKEGYVLATRRVKVDGREEAELVLQLTRGVRVEGFVVDEEGKPLEGVELYIGFSPHAYDRLDAKSDEHGAFTFPAVGRGGQTLVTQLEGRAADHRQILVPEEGGVFAGIEIVLAVGRFLGGRVVDAEDEPIAELRVTARHHGDYIDSSSSTDTDGRFRLEHLPDSDVSIEIYGSDIVRFEQDVPELDREDLVIRVERAAKVAGTVIDGLTGERLSSFRIRFVDPELEQGDRRAGGHSASWSREGHLFTETDGTWDSGREDLAPGAVIGIEASAPGYGPTIADRVVASADSDPAALVISLWPEKVVRGTVVSRASGEPLSGASVKRFTDRNPIHHGYSDDMHGRIMGKTDSHGRFELRGVPAGEMSIAVEHGDYALIVDGPFDVPRQGDPVERHIALGTGSRMFGRLLDAEGRPLTGELVCVESQVRGNHTGRRWEQETGPDGAFSFTRLPAGILELGHRLRGPGSSGVRSIALRVDVPADSELELDLQPRGSAVLVGGLECEDELPDGIGVSAKPVDAQEMAGGVLLFRGALSSDGRFEIRGLEPGAYDLFVTHFDPGTRRRFHGTTRVEVRVGVAEEVWIPLIALGR